MNHPTVARISLENLGHNMAVLQRAVGDKVQLWPAVKANAYGHGAVQVTHHLVKLGYTTVCVAHVCEALELLEAGVQVEHVLVLAGMLPQEAVDALRFAAVIEPVVSSLSTLEAINTAAAAAGKTLGVHLQVDTGMTRQGCAPAQFGALLAAARAMSHVTVRGTMTHFATADAADSSTAQGQIELFKAQPFEGVRHMANSAAIFQYPDAHFSVARPGISVYGLHPGTGVTHPLSQELRPVLQLDSQVTLVKRHVPAGTGVSYGHSFVTASESTLAVVPCGYGDGYSRAHSNRAHVLCRGLSCPVVGRVTMDQLIVDVSQVPQIQVGDTIQLISRDREAVCSADTLARENGTINYEITTSLTARVRRVYE